MIDKRSRSARIIFPININGFAVLMSTVVLVALTILAPCVSPFIPYYPPFYAVSVDIPAVTNGVEMPLASSPGAMVVAICADGKVYLGADWVVPSQLPAMIHQRVLDRTDSKVYLMVDRRVKYAVVTDVLAQVRAGGVENVASMDRHP